MESLATSGCKLMKKIITVLLMAMLAVGLFTFSSCGKDGSKDANNNSVVQDENGVEFPEEWN